MGLVNKNSAFAAHPTETATRGLDLGFERIPGTGKTTVNKAIAGMMFLVAALVSLNASAASYTKTIYSPNGLYQGDMLFSQNGQFRLMLQHDGNLVLSRVADNGLVWANYAFGTTVAVVQPDGNFVAYNASAVAVWNTQTGGRAGTGSNPVRLDLEDTGVLRLYNTSGVQIWTTAVVVPPAPYCGDGVCGLGENPGTCWRDCIGYCGDLYCDWHENQSICPFDCRF
jgi:hypothetical protein